MTAVRKLGDALEEGRVAPGIGSVELGVRIVVFVVQRAQGRLLGVAAHLRAVINLEETLDERTVALDEIEVAAIEDIRRAERFVPAVDVVDEAVAVVVLPGDAFGFLLVDPVEVADWRAGVIDQGLVEQHEARAGHVPIRTSFTLEELVATEHRRDHELLEIGSGHFVAFEGRRRRQAVGGGGAIGAALSGGSSGPKQRLHGGDSSGLRGKDEAAAALGIQIPDPRTEREGAANFGSITLLARRKESLLRCGSEGWVGEYGGTEKNGDGSRAKECAQSSNHGLAEEMGYKHKSENRDLTVSAGTNVCLPNFISNDQPLRCFLHGDLRSETNARHAGRTRSWYLVRTKEHIRHRSDTAAEAGPGVSADMQDAPHLPGDTRRRLIHIDEEYEVRHWVLKWGVPAEVLRRAVEKVGPVVEDVRRELGKQPK
jgi:hypothetical protein